MQNHSHSEISGGALDVFFVFFVFFVAFGAKLEGEFDVFTGYNSNSPIRFFEKRRKLGVFHCLQSQQKSYSKKERVGRDCF